MSKVVPEWAGDVTTTYTYVGLSTTVAAVSVATGSTVETTAHITDPSGTDLAEAGLSRDGSGNPVYGEPTYLGRNGHGDVVWQADAAGTISGTVAYDPFGAKLAVAGSITTTQAWQSSTFDSASGLYYVVARWYSPALGRFLSVDPLAGNGGSPQTLDRYSYGAGDSINRIDPDGRCAYNANTHRNEDTAGAPCSASAKTYSDVNERAVRQVLVKLALSTGGSYRTYSVAEMADLNCVTNPSACAAEQVDPTAPYKPLKVAKGINGMIYRYHDTGRLLDGPLDLDETTAWKSCQERDQAACAVAESSHLREQYDREVQMGVDSLVTTLEVEAVIAGAAVCLFYCGALAAAAWTAGRAAATAAAPALAGAARTAASAATSGISRALASGAGTAGTACGSNKTCYELVDRVRPLVNQVQRINDAAAGEIYAGSMSNMPREVAWMTPFVRLAEIPVFGSLALAAAFGQEHGAPPAYSGAVPAPSPSPGPTPWSFPTPWSWPR